MPASQITLRKVLPEDAQFLERLYFDTRRHEVSAWGWPAAQQEMFLRMQFNAQHLSYSTAFPDADDHIVSVDDSVAGRIMIVREQADKRVIDIALLEEHRNHGVGTELLRRVIDECAAEDSALRLQVLRGNPAVRLYQRLGFIESGGDAIYMQMEWTATERLSMAENLTLDDFAPHVHTRFRVSGMEGYDLELVEANDLSNAQLAQFSLIFAGVVSPWLPQGLYRLTHPEMSECELFLVPLGPDGTTMRYQAAFSRLSN